MLLKKIEQTNNETEKARLMYLIGCSYGGGCLTKEDSLFSYFVEPDIASAIEWHERSAKLGNIEAKRRLANILYRKKGFEDTKKALALFSDLAKQDDVLSRFLEACCFLRWKKYDSAKTCLKYAASQNFYKAEFYIGKGIEAGLFTFLDKSDLEIFYERDSSRLNDPLYWYCRAALHNHAIASAYIAEHLYRYENSITMNRRLGIINTKIRRYIDYET